MSSKNYNSKWIGKLGPCCIYEIEKEGKKSYFAISNSDFDPQTFDGDVTIENKVVKKGGYQSVIRDLYNIEKEAVDQGLVKNDLRFFKPYEPDIINDYFKFKTKKSKSKTKKSKTKKSKTKKSKTKKSKTKKSKSKL